MMVAGASEEERERRRWESGVRAIYAGYRTNMRQNGVRVGCSLGTGGAGRLTRPQLRPSVQDFRNSASWNVIRPTLLALAERTHEADQATAAGGTDGGEDDTILVALLERLVHRRSGHKGQNTENESEEDVRKCPAAP